MRLGTDPLLLALVGLDGLDAAGAHVRPLLVLGMLDRSDGAVLPVLGRLEGLDGFAHAVRDALGVFACVALGVVADKDGLTERDAVRNAARLRRGALGFVGPALPVALEALGAIFGPVDQAEPSSSPISPAVRRTGRHATGVHIGAMN